MRMRLVIQLLLISVVTFNGLAAAQKGSGGGGGGGGGQGTGGPQNGSQQGGGPQGNNPSQGGMGITSGGLSIESVLFSYKALGADAQAISQEISDITSNQDLVIIVTPQDTSAFVQWRSVLQQLHLLQARAGERPRPNDVNLPEYSKAKPAARPHAAGEAYIASLQDIQTLIQTLATMFAVNESVSPAAGAITDVPLVNAVARDLSSSQLNVYVPSLYPPNLFSRNDLSDTFIGKDLQALETARFDITSDIQEFQGALDIANSIAKEGASPDYTPDDVKLAKRFIATRTSEMKALISAATGLVAAIDTFEATLFTGQSPAPPPSSVTPNQPGSPKPQPPVSNSNSALNQTGNQNLNQNPNQNANQNTGQNTNSPVPSLNFNNTPGSVLQQILPADLLAYKIWGATAKPEDKQLKKIHVLTVHALESGGTQLTKSNLFLGSRVYFSGGSVATFSLFDVTGAVECAGYVYDYTGFTREKNVEKQLRAPRQTGAIVDTAFPCDK
jgi:hypothetical protein